MHKVKYEEMLEDTTQVLTRSNSPGSMVILPDTSALIDVAYFIRNSYGKCPYQSSQDFFIELSKAGHVFVGRDIINEVRAHAHTKKNSNCPEICINYLDYLENLHGQTLDALNTCVDLQDLDRVQWNVYWASKLCCSDLPKKDEEGFSDPDKKLLSCRYAPR